MPTEKNLNNLVINKVENKTVYDYMKTNNLINADELYFVTGADENATEAESGLMSAADKTKLDGIAEGAEVNVQSDWNVTNTTSDAYIKNKPTALLADGGNADTVNNHTVETNVPADAVFTDTVYTHPNYTAKTNGLYKITVDNTGHVSGTKSVSKADITALGIPAQDTTYSEAGTSLGLVKSGGDVTITSGVITVNDDSHNHIIGNIDNLQATLDSKVDSVDGKGLSTNDLTDTLKSNYDDAYTHSQQAHAPSDAEKNVIIGIQKNGTDLTVNSSTRKVNITVPTKTSDLTNDSNFATTTDLDAKVDKVTGKGLSTNDYTTTEKDKLAAIEDGANKTVVDTALNSTSINPVQNKVINTKINSMQSDIDSKVPSTRTVNGKALSANITLSASDVGALPDTTVIPSIDGLATETYVDNKVAGIVDSAPATLDTLNELAAALGDDPNFATTVATQIGTKVDKVDGKGLSTNDYTTTEKTKLSGIAEGAEVNQNAFSNIVVGSTTVAADSKTDTLTLVAGDNVTLTPDAENDKITIASKDTIYTHPSYTARTGAPTANQTPAFGGTFNVSQPVSDATGHITAINSRTVTIPSTEATTSAAGLMSTSDKSKLDGIETSANNYTLPVATPSALGGVKSGTDITIDSSGNVSVNDDSHNHVISNIDGLQDALDNKVDVAYGQYAITTAGDGSAYTATVPGITALTAGASFIMIPHTASTTTSPTLNVNGFGAKNIRRRLTSMATSAQNGYTTSWLASGVPFRVIYDGTQWIVEGHDKPAAADLYGAAPKATADANGNNIVDTYLNKTGDTMTGALCFTEGVGFGTGTPASTITNPVEGQFYLQIISE